MYCDARICNGSNPNTKISVQLQGPCLCLLWQRLHPFWIAVILKLKLILSTQYRREQLQLHLARPHKWSWMQKRTGPIINNLLCRSLIIIINLFFLNNQLSQFETSCPSIRSEQDLPVRPLGGSPSAQSLNLTFTRPDMGELPTVCFSA